MRIRKKTDKENLGRPRAYTEELMDKICYEFFVNQKSLIDIALMFGLAPASVRTQFTRYAPTVYKIYFDPQFLERIAESKNLIEVEFPEYRPKLIALLKSYIRKDPSRKIPAIPLIRCEACLTPYRVGDTHTCDAKSKKLSRNFSNVSWSK